MIGGSARVYDAPMTPAKLWFVRAGEGGTNTGTFLGEKYVSIGWKEVGAVTGKTTDAELEVVFDRAYPDVKPGTRKMWLAVVRRFVRELKPGDGVITYDPERRLYFLGEIISDAEEALPTHGRFRRVKCERQVERDSLAPATRNTLGSIVTLFKVSDDPREEVWAKSTVYGNPLSAFPPPLPVSAPVVEEAAVLADTVAKASAFIEDRLIKLQWDERQELVAGILRAMGYRARVAPAGPDRGVDIFASPDGLGLEEPRIFVEVKHRKGKMDAPRSGASSAAASRATAACTSARVDSPRRRSTRLTAPRCRSSCSGSSGFES